MLFKDINLKTTQFICQKYTKDCWSLYQLQKEVGLTQFLITKVLTSNGIRIRGCNEAHSLRPAYNKKNINENIFKKPLSNTAKYLIGFWMADGWVSLEKSNNKSAYKHRVGIALSYKDIGHVEKIKSVLKSEHKICVRHRNGFLFGDRNISTKTAELKFISSNIMNDLGRYGVVAQKTGKEMALNGIDKDFHFWRGVIDGDGTVVIRHYKHNNTFSPVIQIVSASNIFIQQWICFCTTNVPFDITTKITSEKKFNRNLRMYKHNLYGKQATYMAQLLYPKNCFALNRKRKVAHKIVKVFGKKYNI